MNSNHCSESIVDQYPITPDQKYRNLIREKFPQLLDFEREAKWRYGDTLQGAINKTMFIFDQNGYYSVYLMMQLMHLLNIPKHHVFLTTKGHTTLDEIKTQFILDYHDHYVDFKWDKFQLAQYSEASEATLVELVNKAMQAVLSYFSQPKADGGTLEYLVIFSEGGRLTEVFQRLYNLFDNPIITKKPKLFFIEHTVKGLRDSCVEHPQNSGPFINMANSLIKKIEAERIAESMLSNNYTKKLLEQLDSGNCNYSFGVIGCGKIGSNLVNKLKAYDKDIFIHDAANGVAEELANKAGNIYLCHSPIATFLGDPSPDTQRFYRSKKELLENDDETNQTSQPDQSDQKLEVGPSKASLPDRVHIVFSSTGHDVTEQENKIIDLHLLAKELSTKGIYLKLVCCSSGDKEYNSLASQAGLYHKPKINKMTDLPDIGVSYGKVEVISFAKSGMAINLIHEENEGNETIFASDFDKLMRNETLSREDITPTRLLKLASVFTALEMIMQVEENEERYWHWFRKSVMVSPDWQLFILNYTEHERVKNTRPSDLLESIKLHSHGMSHELAPSIYTSHYPDQYAYYLSPYFINESGSALHNIDEVLSLTHNDSSLKLLIIGDQSMGKSFLAQLIKNLNMFCPPLYNTALYQLFSKIRYFKEVIIINDNNINDYSPSIPGPNMKTHPQDQVLWIIDGFERLLPAEKSKARVLLQQPFVIVTSTVDLPFNVENIKVVHLFGMTVHPEYITANSHGNGKNPIDAFALGCVSLLVNADRSNQSNRLFLPVQHWIHQNKYLNFGQSVLKKIVYFLYHYHDYLDQMSADITAKNIAVIAPSFSRDLFWLAINSNIEYSRYAHLSLLIQLLLEIDFSPAIPTLDDAYKIKQKLNQYFTAICAVHSDLSSLQLLRAADKKWQDYQRVFPALANTKEPTAPLESFLDESTLIDNMQNYHEAHITTFELEMRRAAMAILYFHNRKIIWLNPQEQTGQVRLTKDIDINVEHELLTILLCQNLLNGLFLSPKDHEVSTQLILTNIQQTFVNMFYALKPIQAIKDFYHSHADSINIDGTSAIRIDGYTYQISALHCACFNGSVEHIKLLVEELRANVNVRADGDLKPLATPLYFALWNMTAYFAPWRVGRNNPNIVPLLLSYEDTNVNALTQGASALHRVMRYCSQMSNPYAVMQHLIDKDINIFALTTTQRRISATNSRHNCLHYLILGNIYVVKQAFHWLQNMRENVDRVDLKMLILFYQKIQQRYGGDNAKEKFWQLMSQPGQNGNRLSNVAELARDRGKLYFFNIKNYAGFFRQDPETVTHVVNVFNQLSPPS